MKKSSIAKAFSQFQFNRHSFKFQWTWIWVGSHYVLDEFFKPQILEGYLILASVKNVTTKELLEES